MLLNKEIHEQPTVISGLLETHQDLIAEITTRIKEKNPAFVSIAARGTSDNAARYAKYLFPYMTGLPVMLATPSLHTSYDQPPNLGNALVIGVSQSGQAEDVRKVLENAREQGALTIAITNYDDSPMAQTAEYHLALLAGEEKSLAATKTYTAQQTVLAMLITALADKEEYTNSLFTLPSLAQQTLDSAKNIEAWAQRYRYMTNLITIGRGFNYCNAFEVALKIKEMAYISSEGYSEADFRHGPIAMIDSGIPVLMIAPKGILSDKLIDLAQKLNERGAETLAITNDDELAKHVKFTMSIPKETPEWLSPIISIMPGQIFAMHQALVRGFSTDVSRGLNKVTITE